MYLTGAWRMRGVLPSIIGLTQFVENSGEKRGQYLTGIPSATPEHPHRLSVDMQARVTTKSSCMCHDSHVPDPVLQALQV